MSSRQTSVTALYPEVFAGLSEDQADAVRSACAAGVHEGWQPSREDVERLARFVRGEISVHEYLGQAQR